MTINYLGVAKHPAIATKYWTIEPVKEPSSTTSVDQQQAQFDDSFAKNHCLARFFRTTYADFLLNPVTRVFVLAAFLVYIGAASWGCSKIQLGLEPNDLLPDNSYGKRTLEMQEKYFSGANMCIITVIRLYNLCKFCDKLGLR